jgi:U3 small nucleolar RNA-associated protein 5
MVKDKLKEPVLTAFTPNGDYVAILSSNSTVKIWNTNNGDLLAEWKPSDGDEDIHYSCIACSLAGKKVVWNLRRIIYSLMLSKA